jgi:hypothetical protein
MLDLNDDWVQLSNNLGILIFRKELALLGYTFLDFCHEYEG